MAYFNKSDAQGLTALAEKGKKEPRFMALTRDFGPWLWAWLGRPRMLMALARRLG